jgi:hypothetical protein
MIYLFILLLIPLFFVGMVMYVNTLYDFVINSNIDTVLLLVGVFISIISIFILFKLIGLIDKEDIRLLKFQKRIDAYIGLISFTLLFLLGIALIINAFIDSLSYSKLILGSSIVSMYLYIVYYYFIQKSVVMFKVEDMYKLNNDLYMVILYNKDIGKVETYELKSKLKKNKTYKCLYNKGSNMILRISNEVIEVE